MKLIELFKIRKNIMKIFAKKLSLHRVPHTRAASALDHLSIIMNHETYGSKNYSVRWFRNIVYYYEYY